MPALDAVFLDVDDTLYSTSEFAAAARRNAMEAMIAQGVTLSVAELEAELAEVLAEFGSNYDAHFDQLLKRLPIGKLPLGNRAVVVAAAVAAYHDTKFLSLSSFREVPDVLTALRDRTELRIGVITEGLEVKQAEKLVRLGVLPWIDRDAIFISEQVGISKPNTKLYAKACAAIGVEPSRALYVGDHPEKDIAPAHAIGMPTVRHRWKGGKYAGMDGSVPPDHEIGAFHELLQVLRDGYGFAAL